MKIKDKDLEGCTFRPSLVTENYPTSQKKRTMNEFLEDQEKFMAKKNQKAEERKA